jgi:hypothetical protein
MQPLEQRLQFGIGATNVAKDLVELLFQERAKRFSLCGLQTSIVEKWRETSDERGPERSDPFDARTELGRLEDERSVEPTLLVVELGAKRPYLRDSAIERTLFLAERSFRRRSDRQRSIDRFSG